MTRTQEKIWISPERFVAKDSWNNPRRILQKSKKQSNKLLDSTKNYTMKWEGTQQDEPSTSKWKYQYDIKRCILSGFELHEPVAAPLISPQSLVVRRASGRRQLKNFKPHWNIKHFKGDEKQITSKKPNLEAHIVILKEYLYSGLAEVRLPPTVFLPWRWSERRTPSCLRAGKETQCWLTKTALSCYYNVWDKISIMPSEKILCGLHFF